MRRPRVCFRFFGGLPEDLRKELAEQGVDVADGAVPPKEDLCLWWQKGGVWRHVAEGCSSTNLGHTGLGATWWCALFLVHMHVGFGRLRVPNWVTQAIGFGFVFVPLINFG